MDISHKEAVADNPCICRFERKTVWMSYTFRRGLYACEFESYIKVVECLMAQALVDKKSGKKSSSKSSIGNAA
jgi:hypothetical protein